MDNQTFLPAKDNNKCIITWPLLRSNTLFFKKEFCSENLDFFHLFFSTFPSFPFFSPLVLLGKNEGKGK